MKPACNPISAVASVAARNRRVLQIARQVSATIGLEFFQLMAKHLANALDADAIYIGEFLGGYMERVKALAALVDGEPDSFQFELAGSAAVQIALGKPCACRAGALVRFPGDSMLSRLGAEAFIGVPLRNSDGRPSGLIMAVYRRAVPSLSVPKAMLEVFAPRASAELIRQQEEEKLRASEQRYRAFIENNADAMWRIEFAQPVSTSLPEQEQLDRIFEEGYLAECNTAMAHWYGLDSPGQLIGWRMEELVPEPNGSLRESILPFIRSGYVFSTIETTPIDRNGKRKHMLRSQLGIVEDGMLRRIWGTNRDITELKRAELDLDASERRMADLLDAVHLLVVRFDAQDAIVSCNDYFFQLTGWRPEDVIGKNWFDLMIPPDQRTAVRASFADSRLGAHAPVHFESALLGPQGRHWWIAWDSTPFRGSHGDTIATVNVGRDITELKGLETQFRQAQKLDSIGRLAGGIAHDFNNLLTIIRGYSGILLKKLDQSHPACAELNEIRKAAEKGAALTYQLLAFNRHQVVRLELLDLNALVAEDVRMFQRLIGESITLITNLDPSLGLIRADAGRIHQVLLNLVVNSRDAMPAGGTLTISSSNIEVDPLKASDGSPPRPGNYIQLKIADTGVGMSEDVRSRLFEPFFTTKEKGKGTGLGLSTVYSIIKQSEGYITVETELGKGTTFSVLLPRAAPGVTVAFQENSDVAMPEGTETILLVEDQEEVRVLIGDILRGLGYAVLEAQNANQALKLAEDTPGIHLLLTDLILPGKAGSELADLVRPLQEGIKVILMSGYTSAISMEGTSVEPGLTYLRKPFTPETLAARVRQTLDSR